MSRIEGTLALLLFMTLPAVRAIPDGPETLENSGASPAQGSSSPPAKPVRASGIGLGPVGVVRAPREGPGRETGSRFSLPEALEHQLWVAVREGAIGEEESGSLRESLETVLEARGIPLRRDRRPDRLREDLLGDAELERSLESLPSFVKMSNALERLEAEREARFAAACGNLVLAWIDDLLLIPEADRQAWSRYLAQWENVEHFVPALEEGRTRFLHLLPSLSLPSVDPDLIRTGTQGVLWKTILTGRMGEEAPGGADPHARTDRYPPKRARLQLFRDLTDGKLEMEELRRKNDLILQDQLNRQEWGFTGRLLDERDWSTLHNMGMALLERHGERLGVRGREAAARFHSGARGALIRWLAQVDDRLQHQGMGRNPEQEQPEGIGIWSVDTGSLVGQPIYQKLMRDILPLDAYAGWRRDQKRIRRSRTLALRDYAVERMDLRLQLSSEQRERARAASMEHEDGNHSALDRIVPDLKISVHGPNTGKETRPEPVFRLIAQELDPGSMSPWQRNELEAMRKEWAQ